MKIINLIAMLSFFLQACGGKESSQKDIIGTWKSSDGAILEFNKDGTFMGESLPAEHFTFYTSKAEAAGTKVNGSGKWEFKKGQSFQKESLNFLKMDNKNINGLYSVMISGERGVLENKPPWYLFVWKEKEGGERYKFCKQ